MRDQGVSNGYTLTVETVDTFDVGSVSADGILSVTTRPAPPVDRTFVTADGQLTVVSASTDIDVFWDPATAVSTTLSNDDQTAQITADEGGVRSVQHHVGSRAVVTVRLDEAQSYQDCGVGFCPPSWTPSANYPGFGDGAIAVNPLPARTDVCVNSVRTQLDGLIWAEGEQMQMAIDQVEGLIWVRVDKSVAQDGSGWTDWNDDPTADPDAGTGGIDVSAADTSDLYVFAGGFPYDITQTFTIIN